MPDMISIIMPAFAIEKHLNYFEKAIDGIVKQTYTDWELIIACDGGFTTTVNAALGVLKKYKDKRIKLYKSSKQYGPGIIRNMAVQHVMGNYLTFHDSDDWSVPTRFEKLMAKIDANGVVASDVRINTLYDINNPSSRDKKYTGESLDALITMRKVKAPFHFPSAIISTKLFKELGGFEQYKYSSDAILAIKLAYLRELIGTGKVPMVDESLFIWNRHPHSVTTKFENSYTLKKCQSAQRKPLKRGFRDRYLKGEIKKGDSKLKIMKELGLINNLAKLDPLIKV